MTRHLKLAGLSLDRKCKRQKGEKS
jgi:hypothetical protein